MSTLALIFAASGHHTECVRLLVNGNTDEDEDGRTALLWAASQAHTGCLELLIQANAALDAMDEDGNTALMLTAY